MLNSHRDIHTGHHTGSLSFRLDKRTPLQPAAKVLDVRVHLPHSRDVCAVALLLEEVEHGPQLDREPQNKPRDEPKRGRRRGAHLFPKDLFHLRKRQLIPRQRDALACEPVGLQEGHGGKGANVVGRYELERAGL